MTTVPCFPIVICTGLLLSGCAQFQHQTREDEPHALVTIVRVATSTPVNARIGSMSVENRTVRRQTHDFTVVAGRKYVIDGAMIFEDR